MSIQESQYFLLRTLMFLFPGVASCFMDVSKSRWALFLVNFFFHIYSIYSESQYLLLHTLNVAFCFRDVSKDTLFYVRMLIFKEIL